MEFVQDLLTVAINFTALAGFGGIAAHAIYKHYVKVSAVYAEVPHATPAPQPQIEPDTGVDNSLESPDIPPQSEAIAEDVWQTPVVTSAPRYWVRQQPQSAKPVLMLVAAKEVQQPSFQNYSESRLRRIAKEMKIKRYSVLSRAQLMSEISKHPAAIKFA